MPTAYVFTEHGGPEVEAFADLPVPEPGPGQLLVAVRAAGVNPVDWKLRAGKRRPGQGPLVGPEVLGSEVAGVVERVGPGVSGFAVGDAVFGNPVTGGYARFTLVPAGIAAHKPQDVSFTDAAVLPVAAATAYDGLRQLGLTAGATLLITGAGGGVGVAATQLARHFGLRVVGTAGAAKKEFVESLGAVHVARGPRLAERVRESAPGGRVDAVFDLVGGADLPEVAGLLSDRTKLITAAAKETVGELGGAPVARARTAAVLAELARLAAAGVLRPYVTATYPLARAGEALRAVEGGHARGKIVIEVG
ncbi:MULTISPECIES: NADP-dependent oxidoreductase [Streptomyces]|uniref:NADP-dependent oxidoreductase n=1 Tax=Streptomyces TaxID=1883 RepID=UPI001E509E15|nr:MULTISPECIES: NADP-dependent oxidoreductase [Streptomyces]UFQ19273.1 NADP-dependent oxidoreductase [Streptomyces huasconensis]WCL88892.1 NADP-dependent oxidoreductase [Streptomyces sp. JCM 35825]